MTSFDAEVLVGAARVARERAYAPYSGFLVGAALLCESGAVVTAGNVENASYGLTICAERAAVVAALARGERAFVALAVVGNGTDPVPPCGACRQVLREFAPFGALPVVMAGADGGARLRKTLEELLPTSFGPEELHRGGGR